MRILFLTQIIPYPPDAGPRVKTLHVLRYLAQRGHHVILASFIRPEEEPYVPAMQEICAEVHTVPIRRSRLSDVGYWLRSNLTGRPFLIERDDLVEMQRLVQQLVAQSKVDVIHADQLTMTQFALPFVPGEGQATGQAQSAPQLVFDAHNAVWTIVERMRENAPWFLRPVAAVEAQRVRRYEGQIVRCFDHTLAVTEPDQAALLEAVAAAANGDRQQAVQQGAERITVIPIAVDTQQLQPTVRQKGSLNILTLGTLHYPPNADGVRWFANQVFPLVRHQVPQATLTIVGKNPPDDFLQLAKAQPETVDVTGYVEDLQPYMNAAALMVVPVRAGGGMRVRILEAFARAMPVVTTTVGLEGIDARHGEEVLLADEPEDFADQVVRVLQDTSLQQRLAENGRRLAEAQYDWQVVLAKMEAIYGQGMVEQMHV